MKKVGLTVLVKAQTAKRYIKYGMRNFIKSEDDGTKKILLSLLSPLQFWWYWDRVKRTGRKMA